MEENIADALKMAGSVLLFVMGLSIAILAFSQARESMDIVLSYSDRESLSIEGNPRFIIFLKIMTQAGMWEKKQSFQLYIEHIKKIIKLYLNFQMIIIYLNKK